MFISKFPLFGLLGIGRSEPKNKYFPSGVIDTVSSRSVEKSASTGAVHTPFLKLLI